MATEIRETLIDDLDGTPAVDTLHFAVSGVEYEVEVSEANRQRFWDAIGPFMEAGRRVVRERGRKKLGYERAVWTDPKKVRKWAQSEGLPVTETGLPSREIVNAFLSAYIKNEIPKRFL